MMAYIWFVQTLQGSRNHTAGMSFLRFAFLILLAARAGLGFAQESALLRKSAVEQAEMLLNEGKPREALSLLTQKNVPDAPYLVSICYVMTRQFDAARKELARTFSVPPGSAMAYLMLGKLMVRQKMVDAAVPQIETAVQLEPRLPMAHFLLGEIDLYQQNPLAAIAEFQKELAVNPTVWLAYWRLGAAYMRLARYDDAETVLKKAIWLNEASPGAFILLGEIALKKNDPSLASGFLERALMLDPRSFDAHEALGTAYKALGREAESNQHLEISRKLRKEEHDTGKDSLLPAP